MNSSSSHDKIAVLLSNGFTEKDLTVLQRLLMPMRVPIRIISMDRGLVNSWAGDNWGLSFAADDALNESLSADYSALVIPGGQRSIDKLKLTAHTKRFIGGFLDTDKPVVVMGEGVDLLAFVDRIANRSVHGPETLKDMVTQAGGLWSDENPAIDGVLMTGTNDEAGEFMNAAVSFLRSTPPMEKAA